MTDGAGEAEYVRKLEAEQRQIEAAEDEALRIAGLDRSVAEVEIAWFYPSGWDVERMKNADPIEARIVHPKNPGPDGWSTVLMDGRVVGSIRQSTESEFRWLYLSPDSQMRAGVGFPKPQALQELYRLDPLLGS